MRILIDTLGAPDGSGGMQVHSEETLRLWLRMFPEDEVTVVGTAWIRKLDISHRVARLYVMPERPLGRLLGQWVLVGLLARILRVDGLVSTSQVVSPLAPSR